MPGGRGNDPGVPASGRCTASCAASPYPTAGPFQHHARSGCAVSRSEPAWSDILTGGSSMSAADLAATHGSQPGSRHHAGGRRSSDAMTHGQILESLSGLLLVLFVALLS